MPERKESERRRRKEDIGLLHNTMLNLFKLKEGLYETLSSDCCAEGDAESEN